MQIANMKYLKLMAALFFVSFALACASAEDDATQTSPTTNTQLIEYLDKNNIN